MWMFNWFTYCKGALMKHNTLTSLFRRTAALALAVVLAVPTVYAAAGEQKLQTASTLVEGLTYQNTVTVNNSSRVESFSLELEEDSQAYPILLQASGTVYVKGSVLSCHKAQIAESSVGTVGR